MTSWGDRAPFEDEVVAGAGSSSFRFLALSGVGDCEVFSGLGEPDLTGQREF